MSGSALGVTVTGLPVRHLGPAPATRTLRLVGVPSVPAPAGATTLIDRRDARGALVLRVLDAGTGGLHIEAPGHGTHRLAPDGRSARSTPPDGDDPRWERLVHAQVIPCAAALQGLEPLHAAAVHVAGAVTGFVAAAGVGKSTLCARLVAAGAGLVADDVLALEPAGEAVLAHPGPARLLLDEAAWAALGAPERFGPPEPGDDKLAVPAPVPDRALPLARLCFVARDPALARPRLEPWDRPDPRYLLGAGFVGHLASDARRVAQLDAAARVAATVPCARLTLPEPFPPGAAAELLERL